MIRLYEVVSREEHGSFVLDDELLRRLLRLSDLKRCEILFPIRARLRTVRGPKKGVHQTYSVDGLRRILCVNEEQARLVSFFDRQAFFGEIMADGLSARHYLYVPSIILGPSNEHDDTMLGMSARYRIRTPEFRCIPDGVVLFTVSEAYEMAGQTFCTAEFVERARSLDVSGFALWDVCAKQEFFI